MAEMTADEVILGQIEEKLDELLDKLALLEEGFADFQAEVLEKLDNLSLEGDGFQIE